jgi:hypothetical protein
MKRLLTIFTLTVFLAILTGTASATIYSGSDFLSMGVYNGTYFSGPPGYEHLAYTGDDDAVVGVKGPLGTLNSLNMSFVFSNPIDTGNAPFAAFGISDNSTWVADNHRLNVISMDGNQLIGTSIVHVWDFTLNGGDGGDLTGLGQSDNVTLNSILATYGTWEVMRAYAYIGDTGGPSSGSVDINSITVSSVPEPATMLLLGLGLVGLAGVRRKFKN